MSKEQASKPRGKRRLPVASYSPLGLGFTKPHHFLEMFKIGWRNRSDLSYAWRILNEGVCDGCALGTSGLRDWTIDGTHLCLVRLNLLELNTAKAMDHARLSDVSRLPRRAKALRELGRLAYPMRRRKGEKGFTQVSWDEALTDLGERLGTADPDRIACFMTSRGIANEVYFAAQKAWRFLGSPHIDNAARLCHSPSTVAMKRTLGVAASTCSYKDWFESDIIVLFGSNPANDQPVALKYLAEAKKRGAKVYSVNTYREPGLKRYWIPSNADSALFGTKIVDEFIDVTSGGDLAFIYAVQQRLIREDKLDHAFIAAHTSEWESYRAHVLSLDEATLLKQSGSTTAQIKALADAIGEAKNGVFVWSMGLTQHGHGSDTVSALCSLGLSQGFVGRDGSGLMPIRGHSGVQGGAEMGAYATAFPGGRNITESVADELSERWGFEIPAREGMATVEMLEAAERGALDVLYSMGGNFVDTLPQPERIEQALMRVPTRIHQDIVLTPKMLLEPNDVVYLLPARTRYESEGGLTETTTERRVIFSPHVPGHALGETWEEWRIVTELAAHAKPQAAHKIRYADATAIREDIAGSAPGYERIHTLKAKGDQFQRGGRHLCADGEFPLPGGRGRFFSSPLRDRTLKDGQFFLATRRGKQFNSIIQAEVDQLTGAARDHLFMNEADASALSLRNHQAVRVKSAYGEIAARVFLAPITPGNVQMHWPEANPLLDHERIDPEARVPDYNAVVEVHPLEDSAKAMATT